MIICLSWMTETGLANRLFPSRQGRLCPAQEPMRLEILSKREPRRYYWWRNSVSCSKNGSITDRDFTLAHRNIYSTLYNNMRLSAMVSDSSRR